MTRLTYYAYRLAAALSHRAHQRLTKAGLLAAIGMIMAGAVGSDLEQSVAFQAFALLFCAFGIAVAWAPLFRGRFAVTRALPRLASVEQPFRYRVRVRNSSRRGYGGLELMEGLADSRLSFDDFAQRLRPVEQWRNFRLAGGAGAVLDTRQAVINPVPLSPLRSGEEVEAEVQVTPLRRGPLRFVSATIARTDPLGLFRGCVHLPLHQTVLVLPKRYPLPRLAFAGIRNYQPGGVALASTVGESEEFVSLREYRPGDPFRRIHWRSWARIGRPIVKEYQDEFFVRYGLVLDTLAVPAQTEAFEEAVSVAASFACTLDTQESLLDLLFVENQAFCFTTGRGLGQSQQILEVLASVRSSQKPGWKALRDLVLRHAPLLSTCVCVLLGWDAPRRELVRSVRSLGVPVLALVIADRATERAVRESASAEPPNAVHLLRPGRVMEDLQELEGVSI